MQCNFKDNNTEKKQNESLSLNISVKAIIPKISLSKYFIDFGECPLN